MEWEDALGADRFCPNQRQILRPPRTGKTDNLEATNQAWIYLPGTARSFDCSCRSHGSPDRVGRVADTAESFRLARQQLEIDLPRQTGTEERLLGGETELPKAKTEG